MNAGAWIVIGAIVLALIWLFFEGFRCMEENRRDEGYED